MGLAIVKTVRGAGRRIEIILSNIHAIIAGNIWSKERMGEEHLCNFIMRSISEFSRYSRLPELVFLLVQIFQEMGAIERS